MQSQQRANESELARNLIDGVPGAFERFVVYFRGRIFHYSWLMCGQREDAEDVAQETLLKVFENGEQLREPGNVKAWLFRIARNACLMKRRKSVFAPSRELSLEEFMPARHQEGDRIRLEIADWASLPDQQAMQAQIQDLLNRAIRDLPDHYRSVILLRDKEELSTAETARILDVSEEVVRTRLHRARLAIRQILDEYLRRAAAGTGANDRGNASPQ